MQRLGMDGLVQQVAKKRQDAGQVASHGLLQQVPKHPSVVEKQVLTAGRCLFPKEPLQCVVPTVIHIASRSKPPAQGKGKTDTHTHIIYTDIDIHPCILTYIHANIHPDIHGKSVSLAPYRLGSNLRSRSRELATCALGAGRKCYNRAQA